MTQLSPTAQSTLDAFLLEWDVYAVAEARAAMAAAIRALVEQTLPEEPNWADSDYDHEVWSMMQGIRREQLAVAAELEGEA